MIVVVIIGLLATLAVPALRRVQLAAKTGRFVSDLRTFAQAFEMFATENGDWPANAGSGIVPAGMAGGFKAGDWTAPTVLGGRWNWDRDNFGVAAGISVTNFTANPAQLAEIDARLDDGDLATGLFRQVAANRLTFTLEP